jgi:formaldehyde-activating enzyme involved in methanogenesis
MSDKDHSRDIEFFAPWLVSSAPSPTGEYRMRCPAHGDRNASASINFGKGVFRCLKPGCVGGMRVAALKRLVLGREGDVGKASYNPFELGEAQSNGHANVVSLDDARAAKADRADDTVKELSEALVENFHRNLLGQPKLLEPFLEKRGLTMATVEQFKLGYETKTKRYTIPIRDADGRVVNIRKYQMDGKDSNYPKLINHLDYGSPARLFPVAEVAHDEVVICEGELDALSLIQRGFHAVSGTAGAEKWMPEWSHLFEGKHVVIIYDNDQAGRLGAMRVRRSVTKYAASVKVIEAIAPGDSEDVTDYFTKHDGTRRKLRKLIDTTPVSEEAQSGEDPMEGMEPEEVSVRVVDSMDSTKNGRPLRMTATITGSVGPTRSIPKDFLASCTVEAGAKCKTCPMYLLHEGEYRGEVRQNDLTALSRFVEKGADDRPEIIRMLIGANKCNFFTVETLSTYTAEELFVAASVDSMEPTEADYTHRRVFNIGYNYDTKANVVANLTGATWPSPKTARNEFFAWQLEPAVTSLDNFELTPEKVEAMSIFQPGEGESVLDKLRDIALDRALTVTGILGRERMHMAMDLVFHSPLKYIWRGAEARGWLEMIVVGDTRTGKSVTARKLREFYELGHVISCEGATFAGLIGGNKQNDKQWMIQWGEYTINDRRLVVMDEVSGLTPEIISLMSDVRSSGEAQLNKIEHGRTTARVRSIWISNPRVNKYVDEKKTLGIDIVQDVIGNPEDIARFDLAMSVRESDVSINAINSVFSLGTPRYGKEASQALVLWVWSRKPEQVVFTEAAIQKVFDVSTKMSEMYVLTPGLVQMGNAHEKISRIAAAVAARLFSTDETAECIVVKPEHVKAAADFIHRLYSYDNFGYYSRSQRIVRNREIAKENRTRIHRWLRENPTVLEFLLDRKASFRSQDLEEMAHLDRDEVRNVLNVLSAAKMVSKEKSQIILEPELQDLLSKGFK